MDQLSAEEKKVGQDNFYEAVGVTRRDFLRGVVGTGVVSGAGLGAMYFGYGGMTNPIRVGVIGTGDEGNVLIGGCTPEYVQIVAIADIRPSSIYRAFHGDCSSPAAQDARPGIIKKQKYSSYDEARANVKVYDQNNGGIAALLDDKSIEAVIIALPLHLHAPVAVQAMLKGKHVLTEKLMAHNVAQCKVMARIAKETRLHLATGHQRHYSVLYDNAVHLIQQGVLGQLHHIRAQWHRGNLPGKDSWQPWIPGGELSWDGKKMDKILSELEEFRSALKQSKDPIEQDLLRRKIAQWTAWDEDKNIDAKAFGYEDRKLKNRMRPALEELIRWRLWERTVVVSWLNWEATSWMRPAFSAALCARMAQRLIRLPFTLLVDAISSRMTAMQKTTFIAAMNSLDQNMMPTSISDILPRNRFLRLNKILTRRLL